MSVRHRMSVCHKDKFTGVEISEFGTEFWFKDGYLHRVDGPAVIYTDDRDSEWMVDGLYIKYTVSYQKLTGASNSDMILLRLKYSGLK